MAGYVLTPKAKDGLERILTYVDAEFGASVALRVLHQLESAFIGLSENPHMGHLRQDLTDNEQILFWTVRPTLIAYRLHFDQVQILFIERGEMDWERLMRGPIDE